MTNIPENFTIPSIDDEKKVDDVYELHKEVMRVNKYLNHLIIAAEGIDKASYRQPSGNKTNDFLGIDAQFPRIEYKGQQRILNPQPRSSTYITIDKTLRTPTLGYHHWRENLKKYLEALTTDLLSNELNHEYTSKTKDKIQKIKSKNVLNGGITGYKQFFLYGPKSETDYTLKYMKQRLENKKDRFGKRIVHSYFPTEYDYGLEKMVYGDQARIRHFHKDGINALYLKWVEKLKEMGREDLVVKLPNIPEEHTLYDPNIENIIRSFIP